MHVWCKKEPEVGVGSPGTEVVGGGEHLCGRFEVNLGHL